MKSKQATRRALLSSLLSLLLCCSMLLGTTFAWFTDTVTSTGNIIKSGTLAVEMKWANDLSKKDTEKWKDASEGAIFDYKFWEPGYTEVKFVNIKNAGDLAFKYQLNIVPSVQPEAGKPNLADVIDAYLVPVDDVDNFTFDRADADALISGTTGTALSALIAEPDGAAHGVMLPVEGNTKHIDPTTVKDAVIGEATYCIILHMRESATNEYQNLSVGNGFSVKLLAAQMTYEGDSFDELYDEEAEYDSWNAAADSDWYNTTDTEFTLTSAEQLAGLADLVNGSKDTFAGKTVKLGADIDLNDIAWTPIGNKADGWKSTFNGTFIGTGYTISNLSVTGEKGVGLFGYVGNAAHIEGVTIDSAYVSGNDYVGAVMGSGYLAANCLKNCTVKNAEIIAMPYLTADGVTYDGGAKAGAVAGYAINGNITGNKAINCSVTAYRDLGGIAGMVDGENRSVTVSGNSVENVTLTYVGAQPYDGNKLNENMKSIVGRYDDSVTVADNAESNVTFETDMITCVASADGLAKVLTGDEKNIHVVLAANIDLPISTLGQQTGGSGEYKLGGEDTESITIDLNGKKLNITTTYWSAIGAKNDNAVFTIKNGSMTSSQATGTWNSYDLTFANCNYEIENVTFDKAIALSNAGKNVALNDVTINETHDYYALWITAEGQTVTVDGLTVNSDGRGIKIDEQYVDAPAKKVTLDVSNATFKTAKKAAIMVKSAAGADITLSNVDITKVAADSINAVWVDEDAAAHADKVTVTGGSVVVEPAAVSSGNDLVKELEDGKNVTLTSDVKIDPAGMSNAYGTTGINVKNGQTIDGNGHTLDIKGAGGTWDSGINTTGGIIRNLTVTGSFRGIFINHNSTHSERVILENVVIDGTTYTISCDQGLNQGLTATNSTFNGWTSYAATLCDAKFVDCNFGEGNGYAYCRPYAPTEFVGCEFEAGFKVDAQAAVTFENCTLGGVAITAENLATLVTSDTTYNATVK